MHIAGKPDQPETVVLVFITEKEGAHQGGEEEHISHLAEICQGHMADGLGSQSG